MALQAQWYDTKADLWSFGALLYEMIEVFTHGKWKEFLNFYWIRDLLLIMTKNLQLVCNVVFVSPLLIVVSIAMYNIIRKGLPMPSSSSLSPPSLSMIQNIIRSVSQTDPSERHTGILILITWSTKWYFLSAQRLLSEPFFSSFTFLSPPSIPYVRFARHWKSMSDLNGH